MNFIKLISHYAYELFKWVATPTSKATYSPHRSISTTNNMNFWEIFKFFSCFIPAFATMSLVLSLYYTNQVHCPNTFPQYQWGFCECDLLELPHHKLHRTPEYELNTLCNSRYGTDTQYVDTAVLFSQYLPRHNQSSHKGEATGG